MNDPAVAEAAEDAVKEAILHGLTTEAASRLARDWTIKDELIPAYRDSRAELAGWPNPATSIKAGVGWVTFIVFLVGISWLLISIIVFSFNIPMPKVFQRLDDFIIVGIAMLAVCLTLLFAKSRFEAQFGESRAQQLVDLVYQVDLNVNENPRPSPAAAELSDPDNEVDTKSLVNRVNEGSSLFHLFDRLAPTTNGDPGFTVNETTVGAGLMLFVALLICLHAAIYSHNQNAWKKRAEVNRFFMQRLQTDFGKAVQDDRRDNLNRLRVILDGWSTAMYLRLEFFLEDELSKVTRKHESDSRKTDLQLTRAKQRTEHLAALKKATDAAIQICEQSENNQDDGNEGGIS